MKHMLTSTLLTAVLSFWLTTSAWAGYDGGWVAYDRGDYATALEEFRPLAEGGDANAQATLGVMYRAGQGVPQDDAEAVRWYRLAAEQGHATAQFNLGAAYRLGEGVAKD
jgi:TPR repeat protein